MHDLTMQHPARLWTWHQVRQAVSKLTGSRSTFSQLPLATHETVSQVVSCRPAVYNPDDLSRVTSCAFGRTLPELADTLDAESYQEAPLARYDLGPATVIGGLIFSGDQVLLHSKFVHVRATDPFGHHDLQGPVALANSMQGLRYFGHWLSDDVSAFEAAKDKEPLVSLPLPDWSDATVYQDLFHQDWKQDMVIRSRSLTLLRDLGFSRAKADRYRRLRARIRQKIAPSRGTGNVVFLKRGPSGDPREIANVQQLEAALITAGVSIVTAEGDCRKMLSEMVDASVIITIEGSQDRHALYSLRDGGGMITIAPPDRFYVATHEWARCLDMHSGIIVGKPAQDGFVVEPDEVLAMVDVLLARVENLGASQA